jgi:hypothetical protein
MMTQLSMSLTDVCRTLCFIVDGVYVDLIKLNEVGRSGGFYDDVDEISDMTTRNP